MGLCVDVLWGPCGDADSESEDLGWALRAAFPTRPHELVLLLLVRGPHLAYWQILRVGETSL